MNMEKVKKILRIIVFLSLFIVIFYFIGLLFLPVGTFKEWFQLFTVKEFYNEEKNTLDVIYVGNSMIYTAISPMEIYSQTGITGYDFSTQGQTINSTYYYIKEACRYQNPKLIFVEAGEMFSDLSLTPENDVRKAIDPIRFSKNKWEMINDETYNLSNFDKLTCIFPILRYHSRWSMLDEADFRKFYSDDTYTYKGFLLNHSVEKYDDKKGKNKKMNADKGNNIQNIINQDVNNKLDQIIDFCKEKNICLIIAKLPEPIFWDENKSEIVRNFSEEKNIKFIDFNYLEEIDIDWKEDTFDKGNHLNIKGAEKVSKYIGEYLTTNYILEDHRNDEKYLSWNELCKEYFGQKRTSY